MGLVATSSGAKFTPAPAGTHLAICVQLIDLGDQFSKFYGKTKHKVLIGWELPGEHDENGKPFLIWNRYTASTHENAALRAHLEAWRGRPFTKDEIDRFELKNIVGKACMVNIAHEEVDGQIWARVKAVMALPKGTAVPTATSPTVIFDLDNWDQKVFDGFSDNLKKTIENRVKPGDDKPATTEVSYDMGDKDIPF